MSIKKVTTKNKEIKWEVRIRTNGRGSERVRRRFNKRIEAETFLKEFHKEQLDRIQNPNLAGSLITRLFKDEAEYWFTSARVKFSTGHLIRMKSIYKDILPKYGHLTVDKFTPDFMTKYQSQEKARGLENSTINRNIQIFTSVLNHSAKHRRIPYNPCFGYSKLKESQPEMMYWDKSEAVSFLRFTDKKYPRGHADRWIYVVYLTALNTALRAGELWGLKPMDISEDGLKITIRRQYNRVTLDYAITKGNKIRVVPCNQELRNELKELISARKIRLDEPLFMGLTRKPICHDNFIKREFALDLKDWANESQSKKIRFHDLRHTATTLLIAAGIDIKTVKEICGHSDISTTMNYVHMVAGSIENVAKTFSITQNEEVKFT